MLLLRFFFNSICNTVIRRFKELANKSIDICNYPYMSWFQLGFVISTGRILRSLHLGEGQQSFFAVPNVTTHPQVMRGLTEAWDYDTAGKYDSAKHACLRFEIIRAKVGYSAIHQRSGNCTTASLINSMVIQRTVRAPGRVNHTVQATESERGPRVAGSRSAEERCSGYSTAFAPTTQLLEPRRQPLRYREHNNKLTIHPHHLV